MNAYEQTMADRLRRELIAEGGQLQYVSPELQEFYRQSKKKFLGEVSPPSAPLPRLALSHPDPEPFHLADADEFLARDIPPRQSLLTDAETSSTVL
jgi:hypothetical protein